MRVRTVEELRREVSKLRMGRGQRFPNELRSQLIMWATKERTRSNVSWSVLGEMVAVHGETLRAWCVEHSKPRVHRMRSVEVVADSTDEARTVNIVSPSGFRIEGISVGDAITILRALQ
jgi:hypothetical protein